MKINVLTTFSGYDSQCLALDEIKNIHPDFDYDLVGWSEIDDNAIKAHNLLYPQFADRNLGDITKIDWDSLKDKKIDLLTYSSPCQDISQAGKQMGLKEGSETRSSLLWNVIDAIKVLRPKYLMQENVKALVSKKFLPDFAKWCERLESYGYKNYWAVLNSKDFGVPQNRERVFMFSIRDDIGTHYQFPKPFPLTTVLADVLEDEVDEKYYLSDESVEKFMMTSDEFKSKHNFYDENEGVAEEVSETGCVSLPNGLPSEITAPSGKIYYYSPTDDGKPRWTRTETDENGVEHKYGLKFRIRKLTPRECFRLMGVRDYDIDKLLSTEIVTKKGEQKEQQIISNSQLYKCAGNSIVVDVMYYMFENLFYPTYDTKSEVRKDDDGQGMIEFEF